MPTVPQHEPTANMSSSRVPEGNPKIEVLLKVAHGDMQPKRKRSSVLQMIVEFGSRKHQN